MHEYVKKDSANRKDHILKSNIETKSGNWQKAEEENLGSFLLGFRSFLFAQTEIRKQVWWLRKIST